MHGSKGLTYEPALERALADDHAGVVRPGDDGHHGRRCHDKVTCTVQKKRRFVWGGARPAGDSGGSSVVWRGAVFYGMRGVIILKYLWVLFFRRQISHTRACSRRIRQRCHPASGNVMGE